MRTRGILVGPPLPTHNFNPFFTYPLYLVPVLTAVSVGMLVGGHREAALRCLDAMEERGQGPDLQAFNHALAGTTSLKGAMTHKTLLPASISSFTGFTRPAGRANVTLSPLVDPF